jgi:hypothetical protein
VRVESNKYLYIKQEYRVLDIKLRNLVKIRPRRLKNKKLCSNIRMTSQEMIPRRVNIMTDDTQLGNIVDGASKSAVVRLWLRKVEYR